MRKKNVRTSGATKSVKSLPAKPIGRDESKAVRGGTRDASTGLPTGKRMHKPITV
jgi:hypothetical protein